MRQFEYFGNGFTYDLNVQLEYAQSVIVYPAIWPEEILRLLENHMSKKCAFQWGDPMENPWEIIDFMMLNVYNLHRYL